jgi:excisionase family DNA binding protein
MTSTPSDPKGEEEWLTLSEAARLLDVHPTTLRRWANNGDIPTLVTPGGHRRFALSALARFTRERSALRNVNGFAGLWATRAMTHTRQEVVAHRQQGWLSHFNDEAREYNRELGRQLMGLTLQYLASDASEEEGEAILDQAREIGRQYAQFAMEQGLLLRATLEAAMFFRDNLIETALQLPDTANIRPEANLRLVKRINNLLNAVHLSIAEVYEYKGAEPSSKD